MPPDFKLPALASLGELKDTKPLLIIDSREQDPLIFTHLESRRGMLRTGDYSIAGCEELFAVERKSISDLVGCTMGENRERLERELHRIRGFKFKRLLIVGSRSEIELGRYRSRISPKAVLGSLSACEVRFDVPVVFCPTAIQAAREVERWAWYFAREMVEVVNDLRRSMTANESNHRFDDS
jgi:DNA excision repair protein ERCC-4